MPRYEATVVIEAPPEVVWEVLTDLARYPDWNPLTPAVRSNLRVGSPVDLQVSMWRGRLRFWQRERVATVEAPRQLDWGVRMLGGAIVGMRTQKVEPLGDGQSRYTTVDTITGPLAPLVEMLFGDSLRVGFAGVAAGLRGASETLHERRASLPSPELEQ